MKIVLIKDLIGIAPIRIDQRTRNADGSLKYPEQQKTPRVTTLERVYVKKQDGHEWLMWEWARIPETAVCSYSGIVLTSQHVKNYALRILDRKEKP